MTTAQIPQIKGQPRSKLGTRDTQNMRTTGRLPAVIYGHRQDPVHLSVDQKEVADLVHHQAHVIEVVMDAVTEPCLIKEVQWDHLGSQILHIDLARVDLTEQVTVSVDLELTGEPVGLKEAGSFLQHPVNEIEVSCLASQIPDRLKADIGHLKVGDTFTVADLTMPSGVTATADGETIIASIQILAEKSDDSADEQATAAEPEIIGKKETDKKSDS